MYRAAWSRFVDQNDSSFTFDRAELETVQAVPVRADMWTVVLHGWTALTPSTGERAVPAYLLPSLGGANSLRSFADYRFHDRHLLLLSAESRWALFPRIDVAAFVDAGGVAARASDLRLREASFGGGVRVHLNRATVARLDIAGGREGWRLLFRMNEVFRLSRLSRVVAPLPFTP
jgi:outer membrane protein assembly factor BamA